MHFEHRLSMPTRCESESNLTSLSDSGFAADCIATEDIAKNDMIIRPLTADLFVLIAESFSLLILAYSRDGFPLSESIAHSANCIILLPAE
jgi:hypothetical protein